MMKIEWPFYLEQDDGEAYLDALNLHVEENSIDLRTKSGFSEEFIVYQLERISGEDAAKIAEITKEFDYYWDTDVAKETQAKLGLALVQILMKMAYKDAAEEVNARRPSRDEPV